MILFLLGMPWLGCVDSKSSSCSTGLILVDGRCEAPSDDADTAPPDADGTNASLVATDPIECVDPATRETTPFTPWVGPSGQTTAGTSLDPIAAGGFSLADFDGDGVLDLFLPQVGDDQLYMSAFSDGPEDEGPSRLPSTLGGSTAGSTAVDIDGDGDLDLFLTRPTGGHSLWVNDGLGVFMDGTDDAGLGEQGWPAGGANFADMDGDGDLDLFVITFRNCDTILGTITENPYTDGPQALWENLGDGTFRDVSERIVGHPEGLGRLRAASWIDADLDGDPDLYAVADRAFNADCIHDNQFFRNEGGSFEDFSEATSLGIRMEGMGIGVGDINADGVPDFFMSDMQRLWLVESDGFGGWYDGSFARNLVTSAEASDRWSGWSGDLMDVDNDSDLDVYVTFGGLPDAPSASMNPWEQPDGLWVQQADGSFSQVADDWGVGNTGSNRAGHAVDLNGDGWMDLFTREINGEVAGYIASCGSAAWTTIELKGLGVNTGAIGATIVVTTTGSPQTRWVTLGTTGLQSSVPGRAHFGLAGATLFDVDVNWPDGTASRFSDQPVNRHLVIERRH
jgi:hypothetical protein